MMTIRNDALATGAHTLRQPLYFTGALVAVRAKLMPLRVKRSPQ
jgi:hypothetical protein